MPLSHWHRLVGVFEHPVNDFLYQIKTTDEILNPLRIFVSDKEFVKLYVKALLDNKYNVPTIAVLENEDQVDSFNFPNVCCIKPTQASGAVILRKDDEEIDRNEIKKWFSINYYRSGREANYKTLKPKVIVEPIIFGGSNLEDYKFFCFNGEPKILQVDFGRFADHRRNLYTLDSELVNCDYQYPRTNTKVTLPSSLKRMAELARRLSVGSDFVRVDLYCLRDKIYFGELTNYPENGWGVFSPQSFDKIIGDMWC